MTPRSRLSALTLAASFAAGMPTAQAAESPWALCGPALTPPPVGDPTARDEPDTPTQVEAGSARFDGERYILTESPRVQRADRRITAERLTFADREQRITAEGNVRYQEAGVLLTADDATVDLDDDSGHFSAVTYRVDAGHLQGHAGEARMIDESRSRYRDVRLSTCNPGEELWWLSAEELTIDREARQGIARNAAVSVANVPILYTPWLRFPVGSERLTGFLAPSLGYDSEGGAALSTPWYWNIAPNRDATLTPTLHTDRGFMLGGEVRYLEPHAGGAIRAQYLPDDDAFGDDRWSLHQRHRFAVNDHFSGELVQRRVSDSDFLDDFDTSFGDDAFDSAERNLESYARIGWSESDWTVAADAQDWQTVDPLLPRAREPYARQPRLGFDYRPLVTGLPIDFSLTAEAVDFAHPHPDLRTTGQRYDLRPRLSLPMRSLAYHVEPAVAYRYTGYRLDRPDAGDETPQRRVPIYSVDAGMNFVREASFFGDPVTQTLEPRLFYLRVPERSQSSLPLFDTGEAALTYGQLFRANRFTGADRVGDANQLTVGVSTRFIDRATGASRLRFSAGQILYFDDREVTLDGEPETDSRSDYVTELRANLPAGLSTTLNFNWDPRDAGNRDLYGRVRWRGGPSRVLNLTYRDRRGDDRTRLEQAETSFAWAASPRWTLLGGWRWDLDDDRTAERFVGLEYDSCCYALRAVHRARQGSDPGDDLQTQVMLQFVLKGLGGLGDTIPQFFEDSVPGYRAPTY
ncbi:LPS-assembly protein LptD [Arhodomonas sp. AD133]|uniref:LPS-assembly protein LptD n=1 Tax=Arhodomonas sp. AD133 TaxID=3415009 RepID=UPI003EBE695B